eukprot:361641-Chlamydomonas_euryale.AAC.1
MCTPSPHVRALAACARPRRMCTPSPHVRALAACARPHRMCTPSPHVRALAACARPRPHRMCTPSPHVRALMHVRSPHRLMQLAVNAYPHLVARRLDPRPAPLACHLQRSLTPPIPGACHTTASTLPRPLRNLKSAQLAIRKPPCGVETTTPPRKAIPAPQPRQRQDMPRNPAEGKIMPRPAPSSTLPTLNSSFDSSYDMEMRNFP